MSERRLARMAGGRPAGEFPDPPEWLFHFDYAAWLPGFSPERPDPDRVGPFMGDLAVWMAAKERWHAAAHAWLAKYDLFVDGHRQPDERVAEWLAFKKANPQRVIDGRRGMHRANAEQVRQRARALSGAQPADQGGRLTAAEADFPPYGTPDLEEGV